MSAQPAQEAQPDLGSGPDSVLVGDLRGAVEEGDRPWLTRRLRLMHPADGADLLEQLSVDAFIAAVEILQGDLPAPVVIELRDEYREEAVASLPDGAVSRILAELDSDDATTVLADLEDERRERLLDALHPGERAQLEHGFLYPEETAGRLMQREYVAVPERWSVGETIDHARATGEALPETFYEIYVVDPAHRVLGSVPVSALLRTPREEALTEIMESLQSDISVDLDQEEVAFQFQKYSLASAPVKDNAGRLVGMITVDDMVNVIQDENTEDLLALSNVRATDGAYSVWTAVKARAPWLAVNLVTAFLVSGVIALFEGTLDAIVQLAILMPVVAALGGNAGSQGLAVTVRAIAEREMQGSAARRAVLREFATALVNGVLFAIGVGLIAFAWFRDPWLSGVIATAMLVTFLWAGLSGILVPLTLKRLGADPAVASSVFVLTLTDIIAFFSFLGLASALLLHP